MACWQLASCLWQPSKCLNYTILICMVSSLVSVVNHCHPAVPFKLLNISFSYIFCFSISCLCLFLGYCCFIGIHSLVAFSEWVCEIHFFRLSISENVFILFLYFTDNVNVNLSIPHFSSVFARYNLKLYY